ncbi:MAG TPA: glycosyltransferase 87 family protein, partial [Candidatus Limnocylindrales bacterium]|nr:glycosyltransferase 87 family protein [Candidatus Limnocylindrales bacterium]
MSPTRRNGVLALAGLLGWGGLAWLAVTMFNASPRTAAFDLELLLDAGRALAAGQSPYEPSMVAGATPGATDLFYSYPPPVAQAMSLVAALPSGAMFAALWMAAIAGLIASAGLVARRLAVPTVALAPFYLPLGIALLFGNLDALFPFAYGLVLVAALSTGRAPRIAGGVALALAAVAKVHPGSLGLWFAGRAVRERLDGRPPRAALVVGAAVGTGLAVLILSLVAGGTELWRDYVPVAGAASGARLLDARNAGPAAQVALALGGDEALVRTLHLAVAAAALLATLGAALAIRDSLTSLAVAAVASLVVLPVTWYHYPV